MNGSESRVVNKTSNGGSSKYSMLIGVEWEEDMHRDYCFKDYTVDHR